MPELIEENGAEVTAIDRDGWTPLHFASNKGRLEVVKYLVEEAKAEVEAMDQWKRTPLLWASLHGYLEVVKYLVEEAHAKVNVRDKDDCTPVHMASNYGYLKVVEYLFLEQNALMPIVGMFTYRKLMKEKRGRETESQSILDYFLQNKNKYKPEEIQEFKKEFLEFEMNEEDSKNLKSIVKFL